MLDRMLSWLPGRRTAIRGSSAVSAEKQAVQPISLRRDANLRGEPTEEASDGIPTSELMAICEQFWEHLSLPPNPEAPQMFTTPFPEEFTRRYNEYVRAVNALGNRGPEVRDWARRLLVHAEYDARETGAWLLGELGRKGQLGDMVETVVDELAILIDRPFDDDPPKEAQAITAAVMALARVGYPKGISILRRLLFSTTREHDGDLQWDAALALGLLLGEPFHQAKEPIEAARAWFQTHQETENRSNEQPHSSL
jgi:hypothetical protein